MLRRVLYGLLIVGLLWIPGQFALEGDWVGFFFVVGVASATLALWFWWDSRQGRRVSADR